MLEKQPFITTKHKHIRTEHCQSLPLPYFAQFNALSESTPFQSTPQLKNNSISPPVFSLNKWKVNKKYIDHHLPNKKQIILSDIRNSNITLQPIEMMESPKKKTKIFFTNCSFISPQKETQQLILQEESKFPGREELKQTIKRSQEFISLLKNTGQKATKLQNGAVQKVKLSQKGRPKKVYSYLSREFIIKKDTKIGDQTMDRFISHSPQQKLQSIQEQSRKFLLQKMHQDYGTHSEVQRVKKEHIKSLIQDEIALKKRHFSREYRQRYHIPYFSFLSLNREQRKSVINRHGCKFLV